MPSLSNERIAYHNGEYLPESRVLLPFRDRGFLYGDAVFDTARTFAHRPFRLVEHVDRLYRSLRYLRIDPGLSPAEMCAITESVVERNLHLLGPHDDYWVSQRVSRGVAAIDGEEPVQTGPTVLVECTPLPLRERASLYRDGIRVVVPAMRRTPPEALSPRAKTNNYLNMIVADQEVGGIDPGAWAVLLDMQGHLAEGRGSNLFLVRDGALVTPRDRSVLPGISRQTVIEIAAEPRHSLPRGRPRPLRRLCRRRGLPDLDQPVPVPGAQRQRDANRWRGGVRPGDAAPDPGLYCARRL